MIILLGENGRAGTDGREQVQPKSFYTANTVFNDFLRLGKIKLVGSITEAEGEFLPLYLDGTI